MKKSVKIGILAGVVLVAIAAIVAVCFRNMHKERRALKDIDTTKYVTVGEYKGLSVTVDNAVVDEEAMNRELEAFVDDSWDYLTYAGYYSVDINISEEARITDRAVENKDIVNIDYSGTKDGVLFDGGTAEDQFLEIGSGRFIGGFEDGLIGVMPGDTVELDLTFPENYGTEELAGADVVFTVTVNYILDTSIPNDDVIAFAAAYEGFDGITSYEDLKDEYRAYYEYAAEEDYEIALENEIRSALMANVTVLDTPKDILEAYRELAKNDIEQAAASTGMEMTADEILRTYYNTTLDEYLDGIKDIVDIYVVCQHIANIEGLNVSDEELESKLSEEAEYYGAASVEEYIGDNSKETYREDYMYTKVLEFLRDNAVITEK